MLERRSFLKGIIAAAVAPAIIRTPGLIMPIKPIPQALVQMKPLLTTTEITIETLVNLLKMRHAEAMKIIAAQYAENIFNDSTGGSLLASNA